MGFRRKRIIVTDDDQTFLIQMCGLLHKMGLNPIPAENGLEVIKLIRFQTPDLILLDAVMPYLDGLETISYLKGSPSTHKIPIIAMSTDTSRSTIEAMKERGAYDFLPKPVDIKQLHQLLEQVLFSGTGWKRKNLRATCRENILITKDGEETSRYTYSLSERGAFVITPEPLPVGTRVGAKLVYRGTPLTFQGTVIYHAGLMETESGTPPGMAVEFLEGSEEDFRMLGEMIKEYLTQDLPDLSSISFV